MSYLLDTNVVSEGTKPRADTNVVAWLDEVDEDETFLSVISLAELRRGIELLDPGHRRLALERWISVDLVERFHGRVLSVDEAVADSWGQLMARAKRAGRGLNSLDAFIAATAQVHELALVTRNVRDLGGLGPPVLNPWEVG